jgi:hypothetical protein
MITVSVEDAVFVGAAVVGVALLLARFAFDAQLRRAPGALRVVVGFVSMFGVGGLIATRLLDVHGGGAAAAGAVAAIIGAVLGSALFGLGRTSESRGPVSMRDLVGGPASVAVSIPAGRFGSVYVKAAGRTHEYSATASVDVAAGTRVTVTGALGDGLVVAPVESPATRPLSEGDRSGA